MNLPSIFDQLERLRGMPAVYLVLITAVITVLVWDRRFALFALAGQYLFSGVLYVDLLDPRLATVKFLTGWFICLILYITGRQVRWGKQSAKDERTVPVGTVHMPRSWPLQAIIAVVILLVALLLTQRPFSFIPAIPEPLAQYNLAAYALLGLGILGFASTANPLPAGIGLLLALSGGELLYSANNQSAAMLTLLAAANFIVAVVMAYLVHHHHQPHLQTE